MAAIYRFHPRFADEDFPIWYGEPVGANHGRAMLEGGDVMPAGGGVVLIGMGAWIGTLFSIYLTFLEPFVIGATCMWCISSAVVMMALLWITAGPAIEAWHRLRDEPVEPSGGPSLIGSVD